MPEEVKQRIDTLLADFDRAIAAVGNNTRSLRFKQRALDKANIIFIVLTLLFATLATMAPSGFQLGGWRLLCVLAAISSTITLLVTLAEKFQRPTESADEADEVLSQYRLIRVDLDDDIKAGRDPTPTIKRFEQTRQRGVRYEHRGTNLLGLLVYGIAALLIAAPFAPLMWGIAVPSLAPGPANENDNTTTMTKPVRAEVQTTLKPSEIIIESAYNSVLPYKTDSGATATQDIYLIKCVGGPADGRRHILTISPNEAQQQGIEGFLVTDAEPYYPPLNVDNVPPQVSSPKQADRPYTFHIKSLDESRIEITGLYYYDLERSEQGQYQLAFRGRLSTVDHDRMMATDKKSSASRTPNSVTVELDGNREFSRKIFSVPCVGGPAEAMSFPVLIHPSKLALAGRPAVLVFVLSPRPARDLRELSTYIRPPRHNAMLAQCLMYDVVTSKDGMHTLQFKGSVAASDLLKAVGPSADRNASLRATGGTARSKR